MVTPISSHSSSPFTPPRDYPIPATMSHLLALPPLLQPISPPLAALHMARVRLLLDIPTTSTTGAITEWWCHSCGGLREGLGGTSRNSNKKTKRKIGAKKTSPARSLGEKRRNAVCTNCGETFRRATPEKKTLVTYPSARIAARRRAQEEQSTSLADPFIDTPAPIDDQMDIDPPVSDTGSMEIEKGKEEQRVEDTRQPIFNRVRDTEPNLPTYPPPATTGSPEKGKKRKKKSGLAKLLAENKERAAAQNMGGSWGLG